MTVLSPFVNETRSEYSTLAGRLEEINQRIVQLTPSGAAEGDQAAAPVESVPVAPPPAEVARLSQRSRKRRPLEADLHAAAAAAAPAPKAGDHPWPLRLPLPAGQLSPLASSAPSLQQRQGESVVLIDRTASIPVDGRINRLGPGRFVISRGQVQQVVDRAQTRAQHQGIGRP